MVQPEIPLALPPLPPAVDEPWSAEITEAHRGLVSAFQSSRRALNLDESDPIRLSHHLKQAKTFMVSITNVLSGQTRNPLPPTYIEAIGEAVELLVDGLHAALDQAKSEYVIFYKPCGKSANINIYTARNQEFRTLIQS
jgi:hypothetical protein